MGLEYIHNERGVRRMSGEMVVIDRHLYITEDKSRVVEEGDPAGRWLWASPGQEMSRAEVERLGALPRARKSGQQEQPGQEPEDKAEPKQRKAPANKQRTKPEDK